MENETKVPRPNTKNSHFATQHLDILTQSQTKLERGVQPVVLKSIKTKKSRKKDLINKEHSPLGLKDGSPELQGQETEYRQTESNLISRNESQMQNSQSQLIRHKRKHKGKRNLKLVTQHQPTETNQDLINEVEYSNPEGLKETLLAASPSYVEEVNNEEDTNEDERLTLSREKQTTR